MRNLQSMLFRTKTVNGIQMAKSMFWQPLILQFCHLRSIVASHDTIPLGDWYSGIWLHEESSSPVKFEEALRCLIRLECKTWSDKYCVSVPLQKFWWQTFLSTCTHIVKLTNPIRLLLLDIYRGNTVDSTAEVDQMDREEGPMEKYFWVRTLRPQSYPLFPSVARHVDHQSEGSRQGSPPPATSDGLGHVVAPAAA
jgi:hypothetical protein